MHYRVAGVWPFKTKKEKKKRNKKVKEDE